MTGCPSVIEPLRTSASDVHSPPARGLRGWAVTEPDFTALAASLEARYRQLQSPSRRTSFVMHLETLTRWEEDGGERLEAAAEFPATVRIAFAVCHSSCGTAELIVEGSTQECQRCGSLMFRTEMREYRRIDA